MRQHFKFYLLIALLQLVACAQYMPHRSFISEMENETRSFFSPEEDFPVMGGDTGFLTNSEMARKARTPASEYDFLLEKNQLSLELELKRLEGLQSEGEFRLYKKSRHKLRTTSEKIYFLKLPLHERDDYLAAKGLEDPSENSYVSQKKKSMAISQSEIVEGMTKDDVLASWGKPHRVEIAGNPNFENERWVYELNGASKLIYFESGRVHGWE